MYKIIKKLNEILSKEKKRSLLFLIIFSVVVSAIEVVGVSLIMPFISVALDSGIIHSNKYSLYLFEVLNFKKDVDFIIALGLFLIVFYIFRSSVNVFYTYLISSFTQGCYHFIVNKLFKNYMGMAYNKFFKKNSSTLTKTIITESGQLSTLISSLLFMISEVIVAVAIYMLLLFINLKVTMLLTLFLFINTILIVKTISIKIKEHGVHRASIQKSFYEIINKSMGNFKLIKLQISDKLVLDEFSNASHNYARTNTIAQTLLQVPKFLLEAIGFSLVVLVVLLLISEDKSDISTVLGTLSLFVLALYRLVPSVNKILSSYNNILFSHKALDIIHKDVMDTNKTLGEKKIEFNKEIVIQDLYFEFEKDKPILKNINLHIKKGSKIAFVGNSGSGKSTLVDIIMGLYSSYSGCFKVDNINLTDDNVKQWRGKIGYIPQSIYLLDGTVADNVAFNCKHNTEKIIKCLKQAKIYDFLKGKKGLHTMVGEGGIMLSGGQKQRIAIARALYLDPEILVLDEATSALDSAIEREIMDEMYNISKNRTMIIIAHRISTLDRCDKIYTLKDGELVGN